MICGACETAVEATAETCPHCGANFALEPPVDDVEIVPALLPWGYVPEVADEPPMPSRRVHSEPGFAPSPGAWHPVGEVGRPAVAAEPVIPVRPPRRRRWVLWSAAVLLVFLAGTGLAGAAAYYGWVSGRQVAEVLPGNAVAYVQVDLNPSWEQRIAAYQFLRGLPQTTGIAVTQDVKATVWRFLSSASPDIAQIDFATQVQPWLGDRIGLAVVPRKGQAAVVVAVQVTDEEKARAGLLSLLKGTDETPDITMRAGFALLTDPKDTATVFAGYGSGTLADQPLFADDQRSAGARGVATIWVDSAVSRLFAQGTTPGGTRTVQGRSVAVVRFTGDVVELAGAVRGQDATWRLATGQSPLLGDLPADTGAAINVQGAGAELADRWSELRDQVTSAAEALPGLKLPGDLVALLGRSLTISVNSDSVRQFGSLDRTPKVGAIIATDQAARAQKAIRNLTSTFGLPAADLALHRDGDVLTLATTQSYLLELGDRGGPRLSGVDKFGKAVPGQAGASVAGYVDLQALLFTGQDSLPSEYRAFAAALRSAGFAVTPAGSGDSTFSLRVVRS